MRQLVAFALCSITIALAPLCLADAQHTAMRGHAAHAGMHMASDNVTASLAYHTDMYRSFTTTLLSLFTLLTLLCAYHLGRRRILDVTRRTTVRGRVSRYAPSPPDPLLARLALFAHAPPRFV